MWKYLRRNRGAKKVLHFFARYWWNSKRKSEEWTFFGTLQWCKMWAEGSCYRQNPLPKNKVKKWTVLFSQERGILKVVFFVLLTRDGSTQTVLNEYQASSLSYDLAPLCPLLPPLPSASVSHSQSSFTRIFKVTTAYYTVVQYNIYRHCYIISIHDVIL